MIEFVCEGCAILVYAFGIERAPSHGLCEHCRWLCEHMPDPEAMADFRRAHDLLDPTPRPPRRRHGGG